MPVQLLPVQVQVVVSPPKSIVSSLLPSITLTVKVVETIPSAYPDAEFASGVMRSRSNSATGVLDFSATAVSPPTVSTCAVVTEVSLDDAVTLLQNAE